MNIEIGTVTGPGLKSRRPPQISSLWNRRSLDDCGPLRPVDEAGASNCVVGESRVQSQVVLCLVLLESEYLFHSLEEAKALQNQVD